MSRSLKQKAWLSLYHVDIDSHQGLLELCSLLSQASSAYLSAPKTAQSIPSASVVSQAPLRNVRAPLQGSCAVGGCVCLGQAASQWAASCSITKNDHRQMPGKHSAGSFLHTVYKANESDSFIPRCGKVGCSAPSPAAWLNHHFWPIHNFVGLQ